MSGELTPIPAEHRAVYYDAMLAGRAEAARQGHQLIDDRIFIEFHRALYRPMVELIVADTRRKVAEEIALAIEADAAELRLSTRPNNNPAEIAYAVGVEAGAVIARTHAIARGSGNGDSGQEGT